MANGPNKVDYSIYYLGKRPKKARIPKRKGTPQTTGISYFRDMEKVIRASEAEVKREKESADKGRDFSEWSESGRIYRPKSVKQGIMPRKGKVKVRRKMNFNAKCVLAITLITALLFIPYFSATSKKSVKEGLGEVYYCLETVPISDYGQALFLADKMRLAGAAGYVANTADGWCVALEMYTDKKTAQEKMKAFDNKYAPLRIREYRIEYPIFAEFDEENRILFADMLSIGGELYQNLHIMAKNIQNGDMKREDALRRIRELRSDLKERDDYYKNSIPIAYRGIAYVRIAATNDVYASILDGLTAEDQSAPNLLCDIRNSYIKIINAYYQVISETGDVINP